MDKNYNNVSNSNNKDNNDYQEIVGIILYINLNGSIQLSKRKTVHVKSQ